jgi:DNA-binding SARP family transcriptional activator
MQPPSRGGSDRRLARLELLGGFRLTLDAETLRLPIGAQRVVAFLALQRRALQRIYVAGALWPRSDEAHANASLRSALWRLHRWGAPIVEATQTDLRLAPDVRVDVSATTHRLLGTLDGGNSPELETVRWACALEALLPDWYDDWLVIEQERYRQLRVQMLEMLSERLMQEQRWAAAVQTGLAAVAAEPLRESAHRATIAAHLAQGNVGDAWRQYRAYRDLLRRQIGVAPSPELARMVREAVLQRGSPQGAIVTRRFRE